MSNIEQKVARPLSPHLQIYKPIFTMVMSIVHRITGVGLYFGTFLLAWWLVAASSGAEYFDYVNGFFASWFGRVILFGFTWSLLHHMMGGFRHFAWDMGKGFDEKTREITARLSLVFSILLTFVVFAIGYWVKGA
ncbi:MAG: succinate dehydrogenase, cytochrome b556 subunit [Fimbriimonadaceae bacterium]|nr:succinate dehydrogenase, cytochrome b556 subunit [Alphaproteobacteria bacterium]